MSVAPLDFSIPTENTAVTLAGFGCTEKKVSWPIPVLEAQVDCSKQPNFKFMKTATSKIDAMNSHYFTLKASKDERDIDGFISNGDSGGPVYGTGGAVIGVNSAGNWYGLLVTDTFYFAETYHSWVGYPGVKEWLQETLNQESKVPSFRPSYLGQVFLVDGSYVGELKDGLRSGEGQMIYKDLRVYNGNWALDKRNGFGEQTWPPSNKYENYKGQWADDLPSGQGDLRWRDGTHYLGSLKGGLYDGPGHLTYSNGDTRDGVWVKDKLEGSVTLTTKDGVRWKETYEGGKRVSALKL